MKMNLRFLVVVTGQACTLRCKDCGNLSPYIKDSMEFYEMDDIINGLGLILKHSVVKKLQIQGGEAFMHPALDVLLRYVAKNDLIEKCQIATNATLMPSPNEIDIMTHPKFSVRISNYPVVSKKAEELSEVLDGHGVCSRIYNFYGKTGLWYELNPRSGEAVSDARAASRFESCKYNHCLTLERGRLAYCSRAAISDFVQGFPVSEGDYCNVSDTAEFGEKLERYVRNPSFMEACRYCRGTDGEPTLAPAVQLTGVH